MVSLRSRGAYILSDDVEKAQNHALRKDEIEVLLEENDLSAEVDEEESKERTLEIEVDGRWRFRYTVKRILFEIEDFSLLDQICEFIEDVVQKQLRAFDVDEPLYEGFINLRATELEADKEAIQADIHPGFDSVSQVTGLRFTLSEDESASRVFLELEEDPELRVMQHISASRTDEKKLIDIMSERQKALDIVLTDL